MTLSRDKEMKTLVSVKSQRATQRGALTAAGRSTAFPRCTSEPGPIHSHQRCGTCQRQNKHALDEKHRRKFVPGSLSVNNMSRSHQEGLPQARDAVSSGCTHAC